MRLVYTKRLYLDSLRYHFYQYVNERCSKFLVIGVCLRTDLKLKF